MKKVLWFIRNILQGLGGLIIGLSVPVGSLVLPVNYIWIGIILILISWYFKFYYRTEEEKFLIK